MTITELKTKAPGETLELSTDFAIRIVPMRAAGVSYAVGDVAQPAAPTGRLYACVVAGVSGTVAPRWKHDGQVTDGTAVWEPRDLGDASLPAITAANWTAPTGITISGQQQNGYRARALIAGGQAGAFYNVDLALTVDTGAIITKRFKIEVCNP